MRTFIAVIASLLCLCIIRMPLRTQAVNDLDAIDVHLHSMNPENFSISSTSNFGAHRKTYGTNEKNPESLLRRTIAEMDRNYISKGG
jgi:hypothetical protein